jgi:hypothetical protein
LKVNLSQVKEEQNTLTVYRSVLHNVLGFLAIVLMGEYHFYPRWEVSICMVLVALSVIFWSMDYKKAEKMNSYLWNAFFLYLFIDLLIILQVVT